MVMNSNWGKGADMTKSEPGQVCDYRKDVDVSKRATVSSGELRIKEPIGQVIVDCPAYK
jgi:hypothetical protein